MTPKIANFFDNWGEGGGGCATRADSSSRRLPLKFSPVGRSRRGNHQEIWTKNVCTQNFGRNVFRRYLVVVFAPGPADGGKFKGQTVATRIRARRTQKP